MNEPSQSTMNRQNKTAHKDVASRQLCWQLKLRTISRDAGLPWKDVGRLFLTHVLRQFMKWMGKQVGRKGSLQCWDEYAIN